MIRVIDYESDGSSLRERLPGTNPSFTFAYRSISSLSSKNIFQTNRDLNFLINFNLTELVCYENSTEEK